MGIFLDSLWKPIVQQHYFNELIRDSTEFLVELKKMEENGTTQAMKLIGTLDVDPLYPSIKVDLAIDALTDALLSVTGFSKDQVSMITHLARFCIEQSVIHTGDSGKSYVSGYLLEDQRGEGLPTYLCILFLKK